MINNVLLQMMYGSQSGPPVIPDDADALAYMAVIEGTGKVITAPQKTAHHKLFGTLKTSGVYARLKAMHIPVWGTAAANKFNAINPVDSDSAFRLTFYDNPTHNATGVHWNGSSQYANTHLIPADHYTGATGSSMGYYSVTDSVQGDVYEMGAYNSAPKSHFICVKNGTFSPGKPFISQYSTALVEYPITDSRGFFIINRPPVGEEQGPVLWHDGNVIAESMSPVVSELPPDCAVTLGALNVAGTMYGYSNRGACFSYQGYSLTEEQVTIFNDAVAEFLTAFI